MLTSYDFTLNESVEEGVEASAESNAQLVANERARKAAALDEEPRQVHRRLFHHLELVLQTPLRIVVASRR